MDAGIVLSLTLVVIAAYLYIVRKYIRVVRAKWYTKITIIDNEQVAEVRLSVKGYCRVPNLRIEVTDGGKVKDKYIIVTADGSFNDDIMIHNFYDIKEARTQSFGTVLKATINNKVNATLLKSPELSFES